MGARGPAATPNEILRKRGGHGEGWRLSSVTPEAPALPKGRIPVRPPRPLGTEGRQLWNRIGKLALDWLAESDTETLLIACEMLDDLTAVRASLPTMETPREYRDAVGSLVAVRRQYVLQLSLLGFSPADRGRLNLGEVKDDEDPLTKFRRESA